MTSLTCVKSTPALAVLSMRRLSVWLTSMPASTFKGDGGAVDNASVMGGLFEYTTPPARVILIVVDGVAAMTSALTVEFPRLETSTKKRFDSVRVFSSAGRPREVRAKPRRGGAGGGRG